MSAPLPTIRYLRQEAIRFDLDGGALFVWRASSLDESAVVAIGASPIEDHEWHKIVASITARWGEGPNDLRGKGVGTTAALAAAVASLGRLGVRLAAKMEVEPSPHEIWYLPAEHRLRVEVVASPRAVTPAPTKATDKPLKVLIVDDSRTIRILLRRVLGSSPGMVVVAETGQPLEVEALIRQHRPDVMTLDVHMPDLNGVELLRRLKGRVEVPTVMISSLSREDGPLVLEALEAGAVDYIQKPSGDDLSLVSQAIVEKVRAAAGAKISLASAPRTVQTSQIDGGDVDQSIPILIGSSTGGTEALKELLSGLPARIPPILIVQHIPVEFSGAFARRLDALFEFEVKEAEDGDVVRPDRVLIARGGIHMRLKRVHGELRVELVATPPVNRHRPSVDVLFDSAAELLNGKGIGVILTGMGTDGAKGLLRLRQTGMETIAQDEATSVVFGMPREAIRLEAAAKVLPLHRISDHLIQRKSRFSKTS